MAKQQVQLTAKDSNEVYWEDVDVSKGVYATSGDRTSVWVGNKMQGRSIYIDNGESHSLKSFYTWIFGMNNEWKAYTIPDNRRITTTKPLTVDDLKNDDILGFIINKTKYLIVYTGDYYMNNERYDGFTAIAPISGVDTPNSIWNINNWQSPKDIIKNASQFSIKVYKFDTHQARYQWLAED